MDGRRPRVVLSIAPRLLQDTLTVALSPHAEVVDFAQWRDRNASANGAPHFDLAVVSGTAREAIPATVVIDIDAGDGVPSLDALHEQLRTLAAGGE